MATKVKHLIYKTARNLSGLRLSVGYRRLFLAFAFGYS